MDKSNVDNVVIHFDIVIDIVIDIVKVVMS